MYVRKPLRKPDGSYVVQIAESISPISKVVEEIPAKSYTEAFQTYRQIMKDMGRGF